MPNRKCKNCIWYEQCGCKEGAACEDYTPYDNELEDDAYEEDLEMRKTLYEEQITEQNS